MEDLISVAGDSPRSWRNAGRLTDRLNERRVLDRWSRRSGRGRAGCWWCAASPGWARRRCWTTWPGGRRDAGWRGRRACSRRWSWPSPGCISCARRCWTALERLPVPQREALRTAFGLSRRAAAGPVPGRPGRAEPAVGGGRGAAADLRGRRRAVAGPGLGAGAGVRGAAAGGRAGRPGVRGPRSGRANWPGCRSSWSRGCARTTRGRCWTRRWPGRWTRGSGTGSSPRRAGNPLALLELPRGLTPAELAGGFGLPGAAPLAGRIEESFGRQLDALPAADPAAAAAGGGRAVRRPVRWCGGRPGGWASVPRRRRRRWRRAWWSSAPGCGSGIRWCARRPTGRRRSGPAAVARRAGRGDRSRVDPDRRAWHRAQAAAGAGRGGRRGAGASAGRAQARGGLAAAAAFLERAATADPGSRPARRPRALRRRRPSTRPGRLDVAAELLAMAEAGPLEELARARISLLRGQMAFSAGNSSDTPRLLIDAASVSRRSMRGWPGRRIWRPCPRPCWAIAPARWDVGDRAGGARRDGGAAKR